MYRDSFFYYNILNNEYIKAIIKNINYYLNTEIVVLYHGSECCNPDVCVCLPEQVVDMQCVFLRGTQAPPLALTP